MFVNRLFYCKRVVASAMKASQFTVWVTFAIFPDGLTKSAKRTQHGNRNKIDLFLDLMTDDRSFECLQKIAV